MDNSLEEQKLNIVMNVVETITNNINYSGALCYDVVIDENLYGNKSHLEGKAFSTDGINIFGYTKDPYNMSSVGADFVSLGNRIFAGTYVPGKGMSILLLPLYQPFLGEDDLDFNLNATTRKDNNLHGKYDAGLVRVNIKEDEQPTLETTVTPFIEMLAQVTSVCLDKAVEVSLKQIRKDENIALIDKIYEQFKDIPIPACFADDGAAPKTKM